MDHLDREEVWHVQSLACIPGIFPFDPILDLRRIRLEVKKRVNRSRCVQDYQSVLLRVPVTPDYDRRRFIQFERFFSSKTVHQFAQAGLGSHLLYLSQ